MKGYVEIYRTDTKEVLYSGDNMIVDSGRELLIDMLTINPLPHEPSSNYDTSNFCRMFFAIGQIPEIVVSGGAHVTSALTDVVANQYQTCSLGLSSYQTRPPNPRDTQLHETGQEYPVFPNHVESFSSPPSYDPYDYEPTLSGLTFQERIRRGGWYPSGVGDGVGKYPPGTAPELITFNYNGLINSDGYVYPNPLELSSRVMGQESDSVYGLAVMSGTYDPLIDRTVHYEISITAYDMGWLVDHYGGFQFMGIYGFDYYATREKVGFPFIDLKLAIPSQVVQEACYNLRTSTNPELKLFAKKSIGNGPTLGFYGDYNGNSGPGSTFFDAFGITIRWLIRF